MFHFVKLRRRESPKHVFDAGIIANSGRALERDRAVVFECEVEEPAKRDRKGLHLRIAGMIRPDVIQFTLCAPRLDGLEPVAAVRAGVEHFRQQDRCVRRAGFKHAPEVVDHRRVAEANGRDLVLLLFVAVDGGVESHEVVERWLGFLK